MYLFELNKIPPGRLVPQSFPHAPLVPLVADWPQPRQMDAVLGFVAGWYAMVCYDSDEELTAGPQFRPGKKVRWGRRKAAAALTDYKKEQVCYRAAVRKRGAAVMLGRSSCATERSRCGARQEQLWGWVEAAVVPGRSSCGAGQEQLWGWVGAAVVPGRSSCGARQEQLWCQAGAAVVLGAREWQQYGCRAVHRQPLTCVSSLTYVSNRNKRLLHRVSTVKLDLSPSIKLLPRIVVNHSM
ncbi:hypothetical protein HaLaN_19178 [Haematococcus lacustris]|uniref:Uncharacterized protein n=1 Tax=Haematococcus lacustris TaxID=44745 RepID=A0A699ZU38_HAELA|nr:hypothetical protein HaLaN_19178 [Haematococcus lacustris]